MTDENDLDDSKQINKKWKRKKKKKKTFQLHIKEDHDKMFLLQALREDISITFMYFFAIAWNISKESLFMQERTARNAWKRKASETL